MMKNKKKIHRIGGLTTVDRETATIARIAATLSNIVPSDFEVYVPIRLCIPYISEFQKFTVL